MKRRAIVKQAAPSKGAGVRYAIAFPVAIPALPRRTSAAKIAAKAIRKARR